MPHAKRQKLPTMAEAEETVRYDPLAGTFRRLTRPGIGKIAGTAHGGVMIARKMVLKSHLAWFMTHGSWPTNEIGHKDGDRTNIKLTNLMESTLSQNLRKRNVNSNSKTGYKGVRLNVSRGLYHVHITIENRVKSLGWFRTAEAGAAAYEAEAAGLPVLDYALAQKVETSKTAQRTIPLPTLAELQAIFDCNTETGVVTWKDVGFEAGKKVIGRQGSIQGRYRTIHAPGVNLKVHRVVWLFHHGVWPRGSLDHRDGNTLNNAISNLREATAAENGQNKGRLKSNKTGKKGVTLTPGGFMTQIMAGGSKYRFPRTENLEEAAAIYEEAAKCLHGEFANVGEQQAGLLPVDLHSPGMLIDDASDRPRPTREQVLAVYNYHADIGRFSRKSAWNNLPAGRMAGRIRKDGYRRLRVPNAAFADGREYLEHHLVWLVELGSWPVGFYVDHIDEPRSDNRIANLRLANPSQNQWNRGLSKNNVTGRKGVTIRGARFASQIEVDNKQVYLGSFATVEEAFDAYCAAAYLWYGKFRNYGTDAAETAEIDHRMAKRFAKTQPRQLTLLDFD